jgi:hypothetical protein
MPSDERTNGQAKQNPDLLWSINGLGCREAKERERERERERKRGAQMDGADAICTDIVGSR